MFLFQPQHKIKKIGFEEIQMQINQKTVGPKKTIFINILPSNNQLCLIPSTIDIHIEETLINEILEGNEPIRNYSIFIYGENSHAGTALEKKASEFIRLGFIDVSIYLGGMFEWLLLQDIYGNNEFPTTTKTLDILRYRPRPLL